MRCMPATRETNVSCPPLPDSGEPCASTTAGNRRPSAKFGIQKSDESNGSGGVNTASRRSHDEPGAMLWLVIEKRSLAASWMRNQSQEVPSMQPADCHAGLDDTTRSVTSPPSTVGNGRGDAKLPEPLQVVPQAPAVGVRVYA